MKDGFGRNIDYLRLAVTGECDYRCVYCRGADCGVSDTDDKDMALSEILTVAEAFSELGVRKIRLTGGEPLQRPDIIDIAKGISAISGIEELCITTNGAALADKAEELKRAGVSRVNVSLDTMDPLMYRRVTGGGRIGPVLFGIQKALRAGLVVSVNAVLIHGINGDATSIRKLAEMADKQPVKVRFIELMPVGEAQTMFSRAFVPGRTVLEAVPELKKEDVTGTSVVYRKPGATGTVGLVCSVTEPFCERCSRVRVTSDGKLKLCLHSAEETDLRGLSRDEIIETVNREIAKKPLAHLINETGQSGNLRNMDKTGG